MAPNVAAAANAARALRDAARGHKRAQAVHRRGAQQCMKAYAELVQQYAAMGIRLVIEGEDPKEGPWPTHPKS